MTSSCKLIECEACSNSNNYSTALAASTINWSHKSWGSQLLWEGGKVGGRQTNLPHATKLAHEIATL